MTVKNNNDDVDLDGIHTWPIHLFIDQPWQRRNIEIAVRNRVWSIYVPGRTPRGTKKREGPMIDNGPVKNNRLSKRRGRCRHRENGRNAVITSVETVMFV